MKRFLLVLLVFVVLGLAAGWGFRNKILAYIHRQPVVVLPPAESFSTTTVVAITAPTTTKISPPKVVTSTTPVAKPIVRPKPTIDPFSGTDPLPAAKNLAIPFLSQAPKMDWSLPYQEACEEASTLMVDAYYRGKKHFTPDEGDKAILDLVAFETDLLGKYLDTNTEETAQLIKKYFGYKTVVIREIEQMDEIKRAIVNGYPVIIPADGKALDNPNFRNGGPVYHMLVIKGYTKDGHWITNDPGTRKGADFLYTTENLFSSMHDWNGGDVPHGKRMAIVILPN